LRPVRWFAFRQIEYTAWPRVKEGKRLVFRQYCWIRISNMGRRAVSAPSLAGRRSARPQTKRQNVKNPGRDRFGAFIAGPVTGSRFGRPLEARLWVNFPN
jgi:hypothetical protein